MKYSFAYILHTYVYIIIKMWVWSNFGANCFGPLQSKQESRSAKISTVFLQNTYYLSTTSSNYQSVVYQQFIECNRWQKLKKLWTFSLKIKNFGQCERTLKVRRIYLKLKLNFFAKNNLEFIVSFSILQIIILIIIQIISIKKLKLNCI